MKWNIFLLVLLLFSVSVYADSDVELEGTGLYLNTDPAGAKVFIDGIERGETPLDFKSIRSGEYFIRISKDGYKDRFIRVVIYSRSRREITLDLEIAKGIILPEITRDPASPPGLPFEPDLFVDGVKVFGEVLTVPVGWHSLSVSAFGWEQQSENVYVAEDEAKKVGFMLKAAEFRLSRFSPGRKRFNPGNSGALGTTELNFEVSAPGQGRLEIYDESQKQVYVKELGPFTIWSQGVSWNGRDRNGGDLPDGFYTLKLGVRGNDGKEAAEEFITEIDSSIEIRPLTASSSAAGLFFAASPESLPAASYQIEGMLLAGAPLLEEPWKTLPLAISFRVSALDSLEFAGALNVSPHFGEGAVAGVGGSAQWTFLQPGSGPAGLGAAAALSYGWAGEGPFTPFGMGTGAGLSLPLVAARFAKPRPRFIVCSRPPVGRPQGLSAKRGPASRSGRRAAVPLPERFRGNLGPLGLCPA